MHIIFYNNTPETRQLGSWNVFQFDDYTILHKTLVGTEFLQQILINMLKSLN